MKSWPSIGSDLSDYVDSNWLRESPLKRRLREETASLPQAGMPVSAHRGQQISLLARAVGVKRAVDVGKFTGYSALCVAEVLPHDGKIELTIGPALKTLDWLLAQGYGMTCALKR